MKTYLAICLAAALGLSGCASAGSAITSVAVSLTSATPAQAKTLGDAIRITTLVEKSLDVYVTSGYASAAVVAELKVLVPPLHNTLKQMEAANTAGNSAAAALALAAFNEALKALNGYKTLQGVS